MENGPKVSVRNMDFDIQSKIISDAFGIFGFQVLKKKKKDLLKGDVLAILRNY